MWQCCYSIFLDKMLKMVKTMEKTTTEIDLMIARFYVHFIIYVDYITIYFIICIYTIPIFN